MSESSPMDTLAVVEALLGTIEKGTAVLAATPVRVGGNNRTYRVETKSGSYLAKEYFSHPGDTRDRLGVEFGFSWFAHEVASGSVPRPFARDEKARIAIYEYVDGRHLRPSDIGESEIDQAVMFFKALNSPPARTAAVRLPLASEAVFSLAGHLQLIQRRIELLGTVAGEDDADREAMVLIAEMTRRWSEFVARAERQIRDTGCDPVAELPEGERCVSPSDFGFHNALQRSDGRLCFLDFEYAGWDDPSRMICDFFCQPEVPIPHCYLNRFVDGCLHEMPGDARLRERASILEPLYAFKWCCIALAVFLPVSMARRKFANPDIDGLAAKRVQLGKARKLFHFIEEPLHGIH
jgi:hypothetical protein